MINNFNKHRHSIRLKEYDYSLAGLYFVTICVAKKICLFGNIENQEIKLNEYGQIANDEWLEIPKRFPRVVLGEFIIMPNHVHFIFALENSVPEQNKTAAINESNIIVGAGLAPALAPTQNKTNIFVGAGLAPAPYSIPALAPTPAPVNRATARVAPTNGVKSYTVGNIIGAYKSLVFQKCLILCKSRNEILGKVWQRNYYERIIRNDKELDKITEYIRTNPARWFSDDYYVN